MLQRLEADRHVLTIKASVQHRSGVYIVVVPKILVDEGYVVENEDYDVAFFHKRAI